MKLTEIEREANLKLNGPVIEEEVELIDYLEVIWKRRKLILWVTLFCIAAGGVMSLFLSPVYEVTAQIRIGRVWDKEVENPYLTRELVGSDAFLARVIERLNLTTTPYQMKKSKSVEVEVLEGGTIGQKLPLLLGIQTRSSDPQQAVDISNAVSSLLIEEHFRRYEEKLKEFQAYEKEIEREVGRIDGQINELEKMIKKQLLNPSVSAPSVILLQAQLEQKNVQLLNFKKELKDTRVNNISSIITENTRLVGPPVLPKQHVNPRVKLNMAVAGGMGFLSTLIFSFFMEYLNRVRVKKVS